MALGLAAASQIRQLAADLETWLQNIPETASVKPWTLTPPRHRGA
jgi:hypothetical protein